MELAILGAIGLLGYTFSETGSRSSSKGKPVLRHAQSYPWGPGTEVQKLMEEDRRATQAKWEESLQPHITGVVTPNTKPTDQVPFFTSARTQHTSSDIKQRRLETFTGALDAKTSQTGTYSRKQEVPNMFKPEWTATPVNSGGGSSSRPFGVDQASRFIPSLIQNNVLPTQQIRVGKGVGVGPDVAATDGFHPMLRIMPNNVGEYKKNNLPGGVVPGSSGVATRPMEVEFLKTGPPTFWDMERYPLAPGKAAVNARSNRPEVVHPGCGGRLMGDEYYGGGGMSGHYSAATQPSRDRDDNNMNVHDTNVTGSRHGIGGFVNASHDLSRVVAQQREQAATYEGMLTGAQAPKADPSYLLPQTHRSAQYTEMMGNPGSVVEGGRARPQDSWDRTLREQMHPQSQPGVAAPYIKGHSVQATDKWMDRESKRYGQHLHNWMPPAHKATDVRVPGLMQIKPRVELFEAPILPTNPTPMAMAPVGQSTSTYNKLPPTNARLDLSIAKSQLASNQLHLAVN